MSCLVVINGGLGKNVAALHWMKALNHKYGDVYISTSYLEVFKASPYVKRAIAPGSGFLKELVEASDCVLFTYDPYDDPEFIRGRCSLLEAFCRAWHLEGYETDFTIDLDKVPFLIDGYEKNQPKDLDLNPFFLLQLTGGQSYLNPVEKYSPVNEAVHRNYPYVTALVRELQQKYPDARFISYSLPSEPLVSGLERYPLAFWHYRILASKAKAIICIDSSLNHITFGLNRPKVVLWGETKPEQFGYSDDGDYTLNLRNYTGYTPPPFRPLGPSVSEVTFNPPSDVLAALKTLGV